MRKLNRLLTDPIVLLLVAAGMVSTVMVKPIRSFMFRTFAKQDLVE